MYLYVDNCAKLGTGLKDKRKTAEHGRTTTPIKIMSTTKGTEGRNEEGATEVKVNTVEYRSPPGQEQGAKKENVEVIHRIDDHKDDKEGTTGVIAQTAAKVAEKIQPAKEAISGTHDQKSK